jgi:hypothetical protein
MKSLVEFVSETLTGLAVVGVILVAASASASNYKRLLTLPNNSSLGQLQRPHYSPVRLSVGIILPGSPSLAKNAIGIEVT